MARRTRAGWVFATVAAVGAGATAAVWGGAGWLGTAAFAGAVFALAAALASEQPPR